MRIVLILACLLAALSSVTASNGIYSAAAVQYTPLGDYTTPPWQSLHDNINRFEPLVAQAQQWGAKVVVFPEGALGMFTAEDQNTRESMFPYCVEIGEVGESNNPCNSWSLMGTSSPPAVNSTLYHIYKASCISTKYNIQLVINICETRKCWMNESAICPKDGHWQWNTEVVYSNTGSLALKYHKSHLFGGSNVFDQAILPIPTSFETSWGVTFGSFICFDLMYPHPALDLVSGSSSIRDILFSSWWVNAAPSFNALMIQQSWSRINKVNLIAANTGESTQVAGGGIYTQGEPLRTLFDTSAEAAKGVTQILFATLGPDAFEMAIAERMAKFEDLELTDDSSSLSSDDEEEIEVLPAVTLLSLPYVPCLLNVVTYTAANCTMFTPALLQEHAVSAGYSPLTTSFIIPVTVGTDLTCQVSFTLSAVSVVNSTEQFAIIGLEGVEQFFFTPSPLSLQACALQHCLTTPGGSIAACAGSFVPFETRFDAFSLQLIGVDPAAEVFPMLGIDDGQVESTLFSDFVDYNPQPSTRPRFIEWSSTPRFNNQSLFSTMLYAVRPNAA